MEIRILNKFTSFIESFSSYRYCIDGRINFKYKSFLLFLQKGKYSLSILLVSHLRQNTKMFYIDVI